MGEARSQKPPYTVHRGRVGKEDEGRRQLCVHHSPSSFHR